MVTAEAPARFLPIGVVARMVGRSPSTLRDLEAQGRIPAPARLDGTETRLYTQDDVREIRQVIASLQVQRET